MFTKSREVINTLCKDAESNEKKYNYCIEMENKGEKVIFDK